jgi:hypothetical protein
VIFEAHIAGESEPVIFSSIQLDLGRGTVRGAVHYRRQGRARQTSKTVELDQLVRCQPWTGDAEVAFTINERYLAARGLLEPQSPSAPAPVEMRVGERYLLTMANGTRYQGVVAGFRETPRALVLFQLDGNGAVVALADAEISHRVRQ